MHALYIIFLIFLVLQLTGLIVWPWLLVFTPLIILAVIFALVVVVYYLTF